MSQHPTPLSPYTPFRNPKTKGVAVPPSPYSRKAMSQYRRKAEEPQPETPKQPQTPPETALNQPQIPDQGQTVPAPVTTEEAPQAQSQPPETVPAQPKAPEPVLEEAQPEENVEEEKPEEEILEFREKPTVENWSKALFGQSMDQYQLLEASAPLVGKAFLPDAELKLSLVDKYGVTIRVQHPAIRTCERVLMVDGENKPYVWNEVLTMATPGRRIGSRMVLSQAEQARQQGWYMRTLAQSLRREDGTFSKVGAQVWPRMGYNTLVRLLPAKLAKAVWGHNHDAETLLDMLDTPGGDKYWLWLMHQGIGFYPDGRLGLTLTFNPQEERVMDRARAYVQLDNKLGLRKKSLEGPMSNNNEDDCYEDPDISLEEFYKLVGFDPEEYAKQLKGEKGLRSREYTPGLYRALDKVGDDNLDETEDRRPPFARTPLSHGNVFGAEQVSSQGRPQWYGTGEGLDAYQFDSPAHRVKELEEHKFSSTQFDVDDQEVLQAIQEIQASIAQEDLAEDGLEDKPHITVLFGLHDGSPDQLEQVIQHWLQTTGKHAIQVRLGSVSLFPANEESAQRGGAYQDVLKIDVESPDLMELHNFLAEHLEYTETHPEYHPHLTVGYLRPGLGWLHVGSDFGQELVLSKLIFSNKKREKTVIDLQQPLTGSKSQPWHCENVPCEWSMVQAGDEEMNMDKHPQPPIHSQEAWEHAHQGRKEEEVQQYGKNFLQPGRGNDFIFYQQAYDRWRTKPDVLGERRIRMGWDKQKAPQELAIQNDEEYRLFHDNKTQESQLLHATQQAPPIPYEAGLTPGEELEEQPQAVPNLDEMHIEDRDRMVGGQRRGKAFTKAADDTGGESNTTETVTGEPPQQPNPQPTPTQPAPIAPQQTVEQPRIRQQPQVHEQSRSPVREEPAKAPSESKRRGVSDTLELAKEGINGWLEDQIGNLLQKGRFTTPEEKQEALDIMAGQGQFSMGKQTIGDLLVAKAERMRHLRGSALEDVVTMAASYLWERIASKLGKNQGVWDDIYPGYTLSQVLEAEARYAVGRAYRSVRNAYREREFGRQTHLGELGDEDWDYVNNIADPATTGKQPLPDEASPMERMEQVATQIWEAIDQPKQGAAGKLSTDSLPRLSMLILPQLQWESHGGEQAGMVGLEGLVVKAAQRALQETSNETDRGLLERFLQIDNAKIVLSKFIRFLGALTTGDMAKAEEIANSKKRGFPQLYQYYLESEQKNLPVLSKEFFYTRGRKRLETKEYPEKCPDGSPYPYGAGSCQGRYPDSWDGVVDIDNKPGWPDYPDRAPVAGLDTRPKNEQQKPIVGPAAEVYVRKLDKKTLRCPDGSPMPPGTGTCAGREGWIPFTEEERQQFSLLEPPKGPASSQEQGPIQAKYPNQPKVNPSPFGRKALPVLTKSQGSQDAQYERAVEADLIYLPEGAKGTACSNCMFLSSQEKDFCTYPALKLKLKDGASRMTCKFWWNEQAKHPDGSQEPHEEDYWNDDENERAKNADLITLPKSVKFTSCADCMFQKDKYCHKPEVDQPVSARRCCNFWDAEHSKRQWETSKGEKAFGHPELKDPPIHPDQDTYQSIAGSDFGLNAPWDERKEAKENPQSPYFQSYLSPELDSKAMSWLGSGSGGDLVAPPEFAGKKPKKKALEASLASLAKYKALPPIDHGYQPTLAVDFDDTICEAPDHTGDPSNIAISQPRKGAVEALQHFHNNGWRIIIWTVNDHTKEIESWLHEHKVPFDYINENPDQPTDSPKVNADAYIDDKAVPADDWRRVVEEVDRALKASQPIGKKDGYEQLSQLAEQALPELKGLLKELRVPIIPLENLHSSLFKSGGVAIMAPVKAQDRAEEKVHSDYKGNWSRLFDIARAAVAYDTLDEIKEAVQTLEKAGYKPIRKPKNRFAKPLANGYRDYLVNYRLPGGVICEVQFHLKNILAAREREKLAYDVVRAIRAALKDEGRDSMTAGEAAAVQRARDASSKLFEDAWKECLRKEKENRKHKWVRKQLPVPQPQTPKVPKSPYQDWEYFQWQSRGITPSAGRRKFIIDTKADPPFTGMGVDRTGRRYCYAYGRKVPCGRGGNEEQPDARQQQVLPLGQQTQTDTRPQGRGKKPFVEPEDPRQAGLFYAVILNKQGQILVKDENDPWGGFIWTGKKQGFTRQLEEQTGLNLVTVGRVNRPEQGQGYFILQVKGEGGQKSLPRQVKAEGETPEPPKTEKPKQPEQRKPAKVVPANYQPSQEEIEQDIEHPMPEEFRVSYRPPQVERRLQEAFEESDLPEIERTWEDPLWQEVWDQTPPTPENRLPPMPGWELSSISEEDLPEPLTSHSMDYGRIERTRKEVEKRRKEQKRQLRAEHFRSIFQSQENMAFVQDIKANPEDSSTRLIWADWLEEQGMHEYAETIRYQIAMMYEKDNFTNDQKNEMINQINEWCGEHEEWFDPWLWIGRERRWSRSTGGGSGMATLDRGTLNLSGSVERFWEGLRSVDLPESEAMQQALRNVETVSLWVNTEEDLHLLSNGDNRWVESISNLTLRNHGTVGPLYGERLVTRLIPYTDNLRTLALTELTLDDSAVRHLANTSALENLSVLNLADNLFGFESVQYLANTSHLRNLQELYLEGNDIGPEGIQALIASRYLQNIQTLSVSINNVPENLVRALQQRFPGDILQLYTEEQE